MKNKKRRGGVEPQQPETTNNKQQNKTLVKKRPTPKSNTKTEQQQNNKTTQYTQPQQNQQNQQKQKQQKRLRTWLVHWKNVDHYEYQWAFDYLRYYIYDHLILFVFLVHERNQVHHHSLLNLQVSHDALFVVVVVVRSKEMSNRM